MKTVKFIVALVILIISPVLFTGCFGGGDPDYSVEFTLDGTDYSFTKGENIGIIPEGCKITNVTRTDIFAVNEDLPFQTVVFKIPGTTAGTFHDIIDSSIFQFNMDLRTHYIDDISTADDFTVEIIEYGEVGGVIRGTFSGTVKDTFDTECPVTDGYFEVIRRDDREITYD